MTDEQKGIIMSMRHSGYGYRKIAIKLELSRDEVRNYCKAKHLCGKSITNQATGCKRKYFSAQCKQKWEAEHPKKNHEHHCQICGQQFKSSTKNQKYCSHECYVQDRFYRDEQMECLISQLEKGEVVENVPQWIKDLIGVK